jgi:hypothetical protein
MRWWRDKVLPTIATAFILGCVGFFLDFQGLKAKVVGLELHFNYIRTSLLKIENKLDNIERRIEK